MYPLLNCFLAGCSDLPCHVQYIEFIPILLTLNVVFKKQKPKQKAFASVNCSFLIKFSFQINNKKPEFLRD